MADGGGPADVISQFETNSNHSASFSALLVSIALSIGSPQQKSQIVLPILLSTWRSLCPSFILGPERGPSDGSGFSVSRQPQR